MTDSLERELRERFAALRAADERDAPAFAKIVARAAAPSRGEERLPRGRPPGVLLAIAAGLLLAAGVARVSLRRGRVTQSLSTWTSPTSELLRTSGADFLASSSLLPSALDQLMSPSSQRKGK